MSYEFVIPNASLSVQMSIRRTVAYRHAKSLDIVIYWGAGGGGAGGKRNRPREIWRRSDRGIVMCRFFMHTMTYTGLHIMVTLSQLFKQTVNIEIFVESYLLSRCCCNLLLIFVPTTRKSSLVYGRLKKRNTG